MGGVWLDHDGGVWLDHDGGAWLDHDGRVWLETGHNGKTIAGGAQIQEMSGKTKGGWRVRLQVKGMMGVWLTSTE